MYYSRAAATTPASRLRIRSNEIEPVSPLGQQQSPLIPVARIYSITPVLTSIVPIVVTAFYAVGGVVHAIVAPVDAGVMSLLRAGAAGIERGSSGKKEEAWRTSCIVWFG
jgi:hypothetical protein